MANLTITLANRGGTSFWVDLKEELVAVVMLHAPASIAIRGHYRQAIAAHVYQAIER